MELVVPDSVDSSPCLARARELLPSSPLISPLVLLTDRRSLPPDLLNDPALEALPEEASPEEVLPDRLDGPPDDRLVVVLLELVPGLRNVALVPPLRTSPKSVPRELAVSLNAPVMRPSRATAVLVP